MKIITRFKCPVCGKLTSGRIPKDGDLSYRYPRRHKVSGSPCPGNTMEAIWIDTNKEFSTKWYGYGE